MQDPLIFVAVITNAIIRRVHCTLPHILIKGKLVDLIEIIFQREDSLYIACNDAFFISYAFKNYNL